ncbi:hypothetical protein CYLTODRAFT_422194 [Cylindrobasidium torrendii FP15055 ss-10]|uniref:F-box domain-containing protein n=1 Tax=Cylindrobasidium torrendii FP15055 ss-10 TaxID=1314674 RepID=A0A0D7BBD1_9AGAR|nr:hypothetical protein CYLTODRAFT_422194 [Cylindrobasidium torrendii FP15055 ss-10]
MQRPIDTLPLEILGEIIVLALDSTFWDSLAFDEEAGLCTTPHRVETIQNRVAQVSMRFRQAALLDPRYWRTVVFIINPIGGLPQKLARGEALQRSGSLPLRMIFSFHPDTDLLSQDREFKDAYTTILPMYMERISSFILCLPVINVVVSTWNDFLSYVTWNNLRNNRLALLSIYTCNKGIQSDAPMYATSFGANLILPLLSLPGLQNISTNFSLMPFVATQAGYPIKNALSFGKRLTHLRFGYMSLAWFLYVLRHGAQLEELRVQHVYSVTAGGGPAEDLESVIHRRLAALCIETPSDKHLLSFLTLPVLKRLEFTPHQAHDTYPASWPGSPAECSFFDSCSLERLVIWHGPLNPRLVHVIRNQPNLVELTFEHFHEHSDKDAIGTRARPPSLPDDAIAFLHAPNLPRLRSILLVVVPTQLQMLRQMLLSRKEAEQKGEVASLVFLGVTIWNEAHMREGNHREYREALKNGWKHREFLDDILEEFEAGGTEVYLEYQGYGGRIGRSHSYGSMLGVGHDDY